MTTDQLDDHLLRTLQRLPTLSPQQTRVDQLRTRCHAAFTRRHAQMERSNRRARFGRRVLEPALVGALSLIYLWAVVLDVLRLHGLK
jgi:hypothetical protein